tara:strand:+ start:60 stop:518 length:459 start_codon:yes stop_codon:yes gene_type:complete
MGSSKFSSPFFQKSPLHGAYASGADGMVAQSDRAAFDKLTNDITSATLTAMKPNISKCKQGAEYYFDKDGAKFSCDSKDKDSTTLADVKELNRVSDDATIAEEEDNMEDINSTGDFIKSENKKYAAELKQQKTDFANNPGIMNTMKKFKWLT